MRSICLLGIILLISIFSSAQQDEKAKSILDQVSKKTRSFQSIQAEFSFTMENEEMDIYEKNEGTIIIKGQKYSVDLPDVGMKVFTDGKTIWNYMEDGNQVTISEIDKESNELLDDPSALFTIYEKGFDSKFISETKVGANTIYQIELYPNSNDYEVSKINIAIDKTSMMIQSATLNETDGNIYVINVKKMITDKSLPDSDFIFDASNYDDIEVIDFR